MSCRFWDYEPTDFDTLEVTLTIDIDTSVTYPVSPGVTKLVEQTVSETRTYTLARVPWLMAYLERWRYMYRPEVDPTHDRYYQWPDPFPEASNRTVMADHTFALFKRCCKLVPSICKGDANVIYPPVIYWGNMDGVLSFDDGDILDAPQGPGRAELNDSWADTIANDWTATFSPPGSGTDIDDTGDIECTIGLSLDAPPFTTTAGGTAGTGVFSLNFLGPQAHDTALSASGDLAPVAFNVQTLEGLSDVSGTITETRAAPSGTGIIVHRWTHEVTLELAVN